MMAQLLILFGYLPIMLVAALLEERDRLSDRAKAGQVRAERASEAKSRLLANVAHEIKSPVGGVIGIGELWKTGNWGPDHRDPGRDGRDAGQDGPSGRGAGPRSAGCRAR
jgi:signal transduction histidine kinase